MVIQLGVYPSICDLLYKLNIFYSFWFIDWADFCDVYTPMTLAKFTHFL